MATDRTLEGPVVISGGAGGIGRALAAAFAERGCPVALLDLDRAALDAAVAELTAGGHRAMGLTCDVTDPEACEAAIAEVAERFGGVATLVNNAGIGHRSAFADTEVAVLRRVMEVNYFGSVNLTKAALPHLRAARGRIVVTSSVAGFAPLIGRAGYAASKHALHGLFDTLRTELSPEGISVTVVCPSFTESGFEAATLGADGGRVGAPRSMIGKLATADQVARAVVRAAARRQRLLVLAPVGKASLLASRLAPGLYEKLMARMLKGAVGE